MQEVMEVDDTPAWADMTVPSRQAAQASQAAAAKFATHQAQLKAARELKKAQQQAADVASPQTVVAPARAAPKPTKRKQLRSKSASAPSLAAASASADDENMAPANVATENRPQPERKSVRKMKAVPRD